MAEGIWRKKWQAKPVTPACSNLRQQAELTQPELAERLNCEQSWLSKIETGKVAPAGEFIQAVLNYFNF